MAENTADLGAAIGLQTRATPYRDKVFTGAVDRKIKGDLLALEAENKKQLSEQKKLEQFGRHIRWKGPEVGDKYSETIKKVGRDYLEGAFGDYQAGDYQTMAQRFSDSSALGSDIKLADQYERKVLADKTIAIPPVVSELGTRNWKTAIQNFDPEVLDYVKTWDLPDGTTSFQLTREPKTINIYDQLTDVLDSATGKQPKTLTGKRFQNIYGAVQTLSPQQRADLAMDIYENDQNFVDNIKAQEYDKVRKLKDQYKAQKYEAPVAAEMALQDVIKEKVEQIYRDKYSDRYVTSKDGSPYQIAGKAFNPVLADPTKHLDAYKKAGVINQQQIDLYNKSNDQGASFGSELPELIGISAPNTGTYTLKDETGRPVKMDNVDMVYIPKTQSGKGGQWFMSGTTEVKTPMGAVSQKVAIPINERTYGNIISVYNKMSTSDIEKLLNNRMKEGGVTNDRFKLNLRPVKTTQSSKLISPLNKAVSAFEKQVGRKPSDSELKKLKAKYGA